MIAAPSRRGFLRGALTLLAAPAIVRVASLMPVSASPLLGDDFATNPLTAGLFEPADFNTAELRAAAVARYAADARRWPDIGAILRPGLERLFLDGSR